MIGTKITLGVITAVLIKTGQVAFLIWFTAWVLTRYSILEKIGTWFQ